MDTVATLVSICLQYGVPLEDLVRKYIRVVYFVRLHEGLLAPSSMAVFERWKQQNTRLV